jgi:YVTN family beta-propeller protein
MLLAMSAPLHADTLIVLNKAEASASLIDLASGEEIARVETGIGPHEVAVSPDGRTAVVGNYGEAAGGNSLTVIDVESATAIKTISLGEYSRPHGIEYMADGARVAVTVEANKALIVVDVASGEVLQAIDTDQEVSHMVALTPDAKRAFVANIGSGSMTAIDLEKGERIANVPTGKGAEGICVTPDGRHVWVSNRDADTVSVIDSESLEVVKTLPSAEVPIRAKATPDGKWVLVTNADSGELAVFDASTMSEHRRFRIEISADETSGRGFGGQGGESSVPIGVLIAPDSKRAYVAHANAHVVSVIDLETFEVVDYLRAGRVPDGLGYSRVDVAR